MTERFGRRLLGAVMALAVLSGSAAGAAETQLGNDADRMAQVTRDLQYKSVVGNQISVLSASDDGAVWAVTSAGTLMHCLFDKTQQRVRCYDREGPSKTQY
ncbi:hypothetical protein [Govanella unica]|uniref:Uncharacterized protein n=1 Tax=Govanella unica TaxID=2975056 RepID=A0A9X3U0J2_9PROT|nr:hypothetical protein [Govania unica]MDA5195101.1 hypothetical protein [Govania unica]